MAVFCGVDWAEGHHDIALIDDEGKLVAKRRINESVEGVAELTAMLTAAGDSAEGPIPGAIETPRGLLGAGLPASGRPLYPINPPAGAPYRQGTSGSGNESDHVDAMALANILHRCAPAPAAARGLAAGRVDHGVGACLSGRGVATHQAGAAATCPAG